MVSLDISRECGNAETDTSIVISPDIIPNNIVLMFVAILHSLLVQHLKEQGVPPVDGENHALPSINRTLTLNPKSRNLGVQSGARFPPCTVCHCRVLGGSQ